MPTDTTLVDDERLSSEDKKKLLVRVKKIYALGTKRGKHRHGVEIGGSDLLQPIKGSSDTFARVQALGRRHGCWTCGKKMGDLRAASWIADHIPPKGLTKAAAKQIGDYCGIPVNLGSYTLYPSCVNCSRNQSKLVARLNKGDMRGLDLPSGRYMVYGGRHAANGVKTSSKQTLAARKVWTTAALKCHICGAKASTSRRTNYIADHCPPREFNTNYAVRLFLMADVDLVDAKVYPQCNSCSSKQAAIKGLARILRDIGNKMGVQNYKDV